MLRAWSALLNKWRLTGWPGEAWLAFHRVGEPRPIEKPPRIDHIVRISLGHSWFPLYGWYRPAFNASQRASYAFRLVGDSTPLQQATRRAPRQHLAPLT